MKLCVIGAGYVGLVTAACFANLGNEVICVDNDKKKVTALDKGKIPFYEPSLGELVVHNRTAGRLAFSNKLEEAINASQVIFISVGTPAKANGEADISAVTSVAGSIAGVLQRLSEKNGRKFKVIVNKSTVPVGMGDIVTGLLIKRGVRQNRFAVVSNPEFLREGSAVADFTRPSRIIIGADNNRAFNVITELYRPLNAHIIFTSVKSAELIKYVANAFLATKISFINEIANICDRIDLDVGEIADAVGLDKRIGRDFMDAGLGFGGSCLPKDLKALIHLSRQNSYAPKLLTATLEINNTRVKNLVRKMAKVLKGLNNKTIALLGLSFKPETDDLREAPALKLVAALKKMKAKVRCYDPAHKGKQVAGVKVFSDVYEALKGTDAIVLATEWAEFSELDFDKIKKIVKCPILFDCRNVYDPKKIKESGFLYFGIGRGRG